MKLRPQIIIIQGHPCTGKTKLAKQMSEELGLLSLSRDEFKELLFNQMGTGDRDWSMKLGAVSYALFFHNLEKMLKNGISLIIENNFNPQQHAPVIQKLIHQYNYLAIEIFLEAEPKTIIERFKQRWESGERHRGHVDFERYYDLEIKITQEQLTPLAVGQHLIKVDTSSFSNLDCNRLKEQICEIMQNDFASI